MKQLSVRLFILAVMTSLLTLTGSGRLLAQTGGWSSVPTNLLGVTQACPDAGSVRLLYWVGTNADIQVASKSCFGIDRIWGYHGTKWVGFAANAPAASDYWILDDGEAAFVVTAPRSPSSATTSAPPQPTPVNSQQTANVPPVPTTSNPQTALPTPTSPSRSADAYSVGFPCLPENPSCRRDPWWVVWNELQSSSMLSYQFAPGLTSESRYHEAIRLLWIWPEGQSLLTSAGLYGVKIVTVSEARLPEAIAAYRPSVRQIVVSSMYTETSTWMIADSLAHELRHAKNHRDGVYQRGTYADCISNEESAYYTEARFLVWLRDRMGNFPTLKEVQGTLSEEDVDLFAGIFLPFLTDDFRGDLEQVYQKQCGSRP